ncbi:MAG: helix-turn-helix domain-containing protein [Nitrososphaerota archaeon]|nr:helix-turn-helix domain-containing protein [Nitrososphaerota archaeon]
MKSQKYTIKLTPQEQTQLEKIIQSKTTKPLTNQHAKILLNLDENNPNHLTVKQTAQKCKLHPENIYKLRKQYIQHGLDRVLYRKKRETPPVKPKITGDIEAHIIATACSPPPAGRACWTLKLIADKVVLDGVLDSVADTTVMRVLKKRNISYI